jgi:hypothetical protein
MKSILNDRPVAIFLDTIAAIHIAGLLGHNG